nr:aldo/keto reductase [Microvirga sp. HBU67558]
MNIRLIHRALDARINFIDIANRDTAGESEETVGKALKCRRDSIVLADVGAAQEGRRAPCEMALRRPGSSTNGLLQS